MLPTAEPPGAMATASQDSPLGSAAPGAYDACRLPGVPRPRLGGAVSGMWTTPESDPRTYGNPAGEKATYREYLANYRLTIEMKCDRLDADQLARRSVPPSAMSLLGLVRHLAQVENHWFQRVLQGRTDAPRLYKREDDRDWDFAGATPDPAVVTDAFGTWKAEIAKADEWLVAFDEAGLGREVPVGDGDSVAPRDVLVHVIEEYARHAGHADLLREAIDGRTGQ
jgi:uncharacterized damage-inducible protein DinB